MGSWCRLTAARGDLSLRETLTLLCGAEVAHREDRRIQMGTAIAKFPHGRTLEGFDFAAQPSLDPKQVRDLAACRWVANGDALLMQGPPGVGKSHLAIALGREAIRHGYSVLFTSATALVTTLVKGHSEGRLEQRLSQLSKPRLLILDEFGYLLFELVAAHLLFQLVSRRYERGSILITSNRVVSDWGRRSPRGEVTAKSVAIAGIARSRQSDMPAADKKGWRSAIEERRDEPAGRSHVGRDTHDPERAPWRRQRSSRNSRSPRPAGTSSSTSRTKPVTCSS